MHPIDQVVERLTQQCRDALDRARALRYVAEYLPTRAMAEQYLRQARAEMDKARAYLERAEMLTTTSETAPFEAIFGHNQPSHYPGTAPKLAL